MNISTASVLVPAVSQSHPPTRQETLQAQQVGLIQAPIKSGLLSWALVHLSPCVHPPQA